MKDLERPHDDEATAAAIAEITTRTPSGLARRIQHVALGTCVAAFGGFVAMNEGWLAPAWKAALFAIGTGAVVIGMTVEQFYAVKWKFLARQRPWTSLAIGSFAVYAALMPLLNVRIGMPLLGVLAGALGIGLFADDVRDSHRGRHGSRRLLGTGVLSLGLLMLAPLISVGDAFPIRTWRILFFWTVALLAVGAVLFFRERARPVPPPLWERRPK